MLAPFRQGVVMFAGASATHLVSSRRQFDKLSALQPK
jgi:hypothetical protein